ncbi:Pentatricopeptide repeat-containing protein [Porphyridium purpureum]|uniref:Pentatricopeptide repeat-containing protein n=1 Tax=Porphyridium purpureum TaxID=35688 RepID=A0A5J4ZB93_PORPP|nr:Pentatricopeptide repeat-containing protein [Porphyridium purpureum]|eukprot:POR3110..scf295_1
MTRNNFNTVRPPAAINCPSGESLIAESAEPTWMLASMLLFILPALHARRRYSNAGSNPSPRAPGSVARARAQSRRAVPCACLRQEVLQFGIGSAAARRGKANELASVQGEPNAAPSQGENTKRSQLAPRSSRRSPRGSAQDPRKHAVPAGDGGPENGPKDNETREQKKKKERRKARAAVKQHGVLRKSGSRKRAQETTEPTPKTRRKQSDIASGAKSKREPRRTMTGKQVEAQLEKLVKEHGNAKAVKRGVDMRNAAMNMFVALLRECLKTRLYSSALRVYRAALKALGLEKGNVDDAELVAGGIRAAFQVQEVDLALDIWSGARHFGIRFDEETESVLMGNLARVAPLCALEILNRNDQVYPSRESLRLNARHALITSLLNEQENRAERTADALEVLNDCFERRMETKFTCAQYLRVLFRSEPRPALGYTACLDELQRRGWNFSRAVAAAMLDETLQQQDIVTAKQVLNQMRACELSMCSQCLEAVVAFYCTTQQLDAALELIQLMPQTYGVQPSASMVLQVCSASARTGLRTLDAFGVLELVQTQENDAMDERSLYLARALLECRLGEFVPDSALEQLAAAENAGYGVTTAMYERVLAVFECMALEERASRSKVDEKNGPGALVGGSALISSTTTRPRNTFQGVATRILEHQESIQGERRSFESALRLSSSSGAVRESVAILNSWWDVSSSSSGSGKRARKHQRSPTARAYAAVIRSCADARLMEIGVEYYVQMTQRGVVPDCEVYEALIGGFGLTLDLESAQRVWKEMGDRGVQPRRETWEAMIDAMLLHPRGMRLACTYIEQMNKMGGYSLTDRYFQALIRDAADLEKIVSVFSSMRSQCQEISEQTLLTVLAACRASDDMPSIEQALQLMNQSGLALNRSVMEYLRDFRGTAPGSKQTRKKNVQLPELAQPGRVNSDTADAEYKEFNRLLDGGF